MAIRGKVIFVGQMTDGTRKKDGQPWKKQEYVIETDGQYPKKVAFSLMNDKIDKAAIQMGQTLEVDVDAQSREYNGKWYTELTAWRVSNLGIVQQPQNMNSVYQQQAPQGYAPTATPTNQFGQPAQTSAVPSSSEDLPF